MDISSYSRTIFSVMLHLRATRGGTKIWAKITSVQVKKRSGKGGFRRRGRGEGGVAKLMQVLSRPIGA